MCGRYSVLKKTLLIANSLVKKNINVDLEQDNFNCAPGGKYPCIKSATNGKYLEMTIFGLKPSWSKPDFRRLHNARLEGIETKVSFKKLIINSRAVIPITGFFEWLKGKKKIPHYFTRTDDQDIFLAGIHDDGQFTIITREATEENSKIHHRQPLIISKSQINNYFNLNNNAVEFLKSVKAPKLKFHPVATDVNNPSKNDATLINPIN
tara:strand:+ start:979 stop:1602 length:624 start_codon:yes stop_codon:yes gene_type:complete